MVVNALKQMGNLMREDKSQQMLTFAGRQSFDAIEVDADVHLRTAENKPGIRDGLSHRSEWPRRSGSLDSNKGAGAGIVPFDDNDNGLKHSGGNDLGPMHDASGPSPIEKWAISAEARLMAKPV